MQHTKHNMLKLASGEQWCTKHNNNTRMNKWTYLMQGQGHESKHQMWHVKRTAVCLHVHDLALDTSHHSRSCHGGGNNVNMLITICTQLPCVYREPHMQILYQFCLYVVANPTVMHTGSSICSNLAIFSNILHIFWRRIWYICIWGSPYAYESCVHIWWLTNTPRWRQKTTNK